MTDFASREISTPQKLMDFFARNMKYGFVYRGKVFTDDDKDFQKNMDKFYKLRLGEDFIKNGYGVCWDFCVLEDEFFETMKIEHKCFFIGGFVNRAEGGPTHTFALFFSKGKWRWFEYAWQYYRGIHEYDSLESALADVIQKFKNFYNQKLDARIYEMPRFTKRLNTFEFVERCLEQGEKKF